MDRDGNEVAARDTTQQTDPHDIAGARVDFVHGGQHPPAHLGDVAGRHLTHDATRRHRASRADHLPRAALGVDHRGPQHGVRVQQGLNDRLQDVHREIGRGTQQCGVRQPAMAPLTEHPRRVGQWCDLTEVVGPVGLVGLVATRVDRGGEVPDGRRRRDHPDTDPQAPRASRRGQRDGDDAVESQIEEVVVDAGGHPAEDLGECIGQGTLRLRLRFGCVRTGFQRGAGEVRQRVRVQLAVDGHRQLRHHEQPRRNHVRRQTIGHSGADGDRIRGPVGDRDDKTHENGADGTAHHDSSRIAHARRTAQRLLDFADLHPVTAHLHLIVGPSQVVQRATGAAAHQVAGPIHPPAGRPERVGHKPFRGLGEPAQIAAGDLRPGEIQLAGDAVGHLTQPGIEHVSAHGGGRSADGGRRRGGVGTGHVGHHRLHGGLGGAVTVVHRHAGQ